MADTIRETIIKEIVATLEGFSSYSVLADPSIERGWEAFDPDVTPMPIIAVLPGIETVERIHGIDRCEMPVGIRSLFKFGNSNPSAIGEAALGELIVASLSGGVPTNAEDIFYSGGGVDEYPGDLGETLLNVSITVVVRYETDAGDPYTLTT